jgi:hypothetical protein
LQEIFIINSLSDEIETFVSKVCNHALRNHKNKNRKIKELREWQLLGEYIKLENIVLPAQSRLSQPKIFSIQTLNSKGKYQDRLLKITPKSFLIIDEKINYVSYEKLLAEIEEISAPPSNLEIHMRFAPEGNKKAFLFLKNEKEDENGDFDVKKFMCRSLSDRVAILDEIFETVVSSKYCKTLQAYQVIKVNKTGKKQERLFKLTNDNILNVDGRIIKNEFPYLAIESIQLDSIKKDTLNIKMLHEDKIRDILTSQGDQIIESVQESLQRLKERTKRFRENDICEITDKDLEEVKFDGEFGFLTKEDFEALSLDFGDDLVEVRHQESVVIETIPHDNYQLTQKQLNMRKSFIIESVTDQLIEENEVKSESEEEEDDEVMEI